MDAIVKAAGFSLSKRKPAAKQVVLEFDKSLDKAAGISKRLQIMHAQNNDETKDSSTLNKTKTSMEILLIAAQLAQILYDIWSSMLTNLSSFNTDTLKAINESLNNISEPLLEMGLKKFVPDFSSLLA